MKKHPVCPKVEGRNCVDCAHWRYSSGSPGYSEWTPGSDASMSCDKQYWKWDQEIDEERDVKAKLHTAETCADFEFSPIERTKP